MDCNTIYGITVLMPTFNQEAFISRAIVSLQLQTFTNWELIIINDGSTDNTARIVKERLGDLRIRYFENEKNEGLGFTLNKGLELAQYEAIAYLPSDDIYFSIHLESMLSKLNQLNDTNLIFSGVKYRYNDTPVSSSSESTEGIIPGYDLQLVQVLHRKTNHRWIERREYVTDNLNKMFWTNFSAAGQYAQTHLVTCEWVNHPLQRHKIINEKFGGSIHFYKRTYNITTYINFLSSTGVKINERQDYAKFRKKLKHTSTKLKILLVGELAYNPERIYALEEEGHKLYGLWIPYGDCYNTIGPLPFGNVEDIPLDNWVEQVKKIKPDIIYALLNHQAIPLAHHVLFQNLGIPFVWHFKEGPFYSRQYGSWKQLIDLYRYSDGQIYTNIEVQDWFQQFIYNDKKMSYILDGDLPKKDWFIEEKTSKLSDIDGEIHTVIPGRPMGLTSEHIAELFKQKIHLHLYGDIQQSIWADWLVKANELAPNYVHLHRHCAAENWVKEFSKYDAGWLHYFESNNQGELMKASWLDLNYPARIPTLAAAGLPMIQKNNNGHLASTQRLVEEMGLGVFFNSFDDLGQKLSDKKLMDRISENVWNCRFYFTFDYHVKDLISFFKEVIEKKKIAK